MVQEPRDGRPGRVVVGVHGSASSLEALARAVELAVARGWELDVVTAWPDVDEEFIRDVPGRYVVARGLAFQRHREALEQIAPDLAARTRTFVMNARPARALLANVEGDTVIVVGTGRDPALRGRPSIGEECLRAGGCSVLEVPLQPALGSDLGAQPEPAHAFRPQRPRRRRTRPELATA